MVIAALRQILSGVYKETKSARKFRENFFVFSSECGRGQQQTPGCRLLTDVDVLKTT